VTTEVDGGDVRVTVRVPASIIGKVDAAARRDGLSRSAVLREALRVGVDVGPRPGFGRVDLIEAPHAPSSAVARLMAAERLA
jgi:hypothetical protein